MRVLVIGDIIGRPGRTLVASLLPRIVSRNAVDFVIANGENSAGGIGITEEKARELFSSGVDVITTGNHVWKHRKVHAYLDAEPRVLRPANYPRAAPGRGWGVFETAGGVRIGVLNLQGRVFMNPLDSPFEAADQAVDGIRQSTPIAIVDFHAEATSEKQAMGWHLDGRVSLVVGTHTHVQTADERVLPLGTGYLTDVGMTGPRDSVIGMKTDAALTRFLVGLPQEMKPAKNGLILEGVLADIDPATGRALAVARIRETP